MLSYHLDYIIHRRIAFDRLDWYAVNSDRQHSITLTTRCPEQTQAVGRLLGSDARAGDVFLLSGELGAGKTCLTQGILWGLGGDEYARSPTFVLMCEYYARLTLYHMDLYRLDSVDEVIDLGLDDYILGEGVCVVEWAEKGLDAFPGENMRIRIEDIGGGSRALTFTAESSRYSEMLDALRARFADDSAHAPELPAVSDEAQ